MSFKNIAKMVLLGTAFIFIGCGAEVDSSVHENEIVNKNDINITFTSHGDIQELAFKFDKISFDVNGEDRKDEINITQKTPDVKAVFSPRSPLPEGNVTLYINIPFSNSFWSWHYGLYGTKSLEKTLNFIVDTISPTISSLDDTLIDTSKPLEFSISDEGTGLKQTPTININGKTSPLTKTDKKDIFTYTLKPNIKDINITISAEDKANNITTKTFTFKQDPNVIKSLNLSFKNKTILKDTNITATITAITQSGESKNIDTDITWITVPEDSIKLTNTNTITPTKDTNITLQAKYKNITSNPITLNVKWIVNGHTLPPKPDPKINNSTLLGIDTNNNGVRDDVERWIYETYKDKHPVHIDIAMQAGRAYKKVLQMPEKAWEIMEEVEAPIHCEAYYKVYAKYFNEKILIQTNITGKYFRYVIYFNTKKRRNVYRKYDSAFSGHTFALPKAKELKSKCDFNTSKYSK